MKRKQKIISNSRRLVVYIHSYLVSRRRWNTLQFCVLQRPLWSRQCGEKKKTAVNHQAQWVLRRGRIRRKKRVVQPEKTSQKWHSSLIQILFFRTSFWCFCSRRSRLQELGQREDGSVSSSLRDWIQSCRRFCVPFVGVLVLNFTFCCQTVF